MLWRSLPAWLAGRALWDAKLLRHNKAPDGQLVDFQPSDPRATDCQSADGKCTEGYGADRNCAKRKPAYGERTGCNRTKRSWGSAYRFHVVQLSAGKVEGQ